MSSDPEQPISWWQRWKEFQLRDWLRRMISPEDSTHELALGVSVGMFVACTPLYGLHLAMIIATGFLTRRVARFNKALAIATSYVNNPITFAPMLWVSYKIGTQVTPPTSGPVDVVKAAEGIDWQHGLTAIPKFLESIGRPTLVGCMVLGAITSLIVYPLAWGAITWYRRRDSTTTTLASPVSPHQP